MPKKLVGSWLGRPLVAIIVVAILVGFLFVVQPALGQTAAKQPLAFSISEQTTITVTVSWNKAAIPADFYRLEKRICGGKQGLWQREIDLTTKDPVFDSNKNTFAHTFKNLQTGKCYDFRLTARSGAITSSAIVPGVKPAVASAILLEAAVTPGPSGRVVGTGLQFFGAPATTPTVKITFTPSSPNLGDLVAFTISSTPISGTTIKTVSGLIDNVPVTVICGAPSTGGVLTCTYRTVDLTSGTHSLSASATDNLNRKGTTTVSLSVSTTPTTTPLASVVTTGGPGVTALPSPSIPTTGQAVLLSATATPTSTSALVQMVDFLVDSKPVGAMCVPATTGSGLKCISTTLTLTAGAHPYLVSATDSARKKGTASGTLSVAASTPPSATYTLAVSKSGTGTVASIYPTASTINCGTTCSSNLQSGTSVILTATPASGYTFSGWGGGECVGAGTCTVTLDKAETITATFKQSVALPTPPSLVTPYQLSVTKSGTGAGTVSSSPTGINCGTTCSAYFNSGTSVTLTAAPASGSDFAGWGGACTGTGACTVSMSAAKTVTATFNAQPQQPATYTLTVSKSGTGTGTVSGIGVNCGSDCSEALVPGTSVTLTAAPATGSLFSGWSGACTGAGICTLTMDSDKGALATFSQAPQQPSTYTLTVTTSAGGTVSAIGLSCSGATCTGTYNSGTAVTLTAKPAAGFVLTSWSGACTGTSTTCTVTINSDKTAAATFTSTTLPPPAQQTLTVQTSGTGSGTVTSDLGSLNCAGNTCSGLFTTGTEVTLTATPATDSLFSGWSGACTGTSTTCTVTLDSAKTVTATFSPKPSEQTLSVTKTNVGGGGGSVTSSPAGLNCLASTCTGTYNYGTSVALTAIPDDASKFDGWSGDCSGTGICTLSMTASKSVTATFSPVTPTTQKLSVTKSGDGTGSITSNPTAINCGTSCSATIQTGTSITLTASASSDSVFTGWGGDCASAGKAATCTLSMTTGKSASATFTKSVSLPTPPELVTPQTLTVQKSGTGTGTVSGIGVNCGSDCSESFAHGTAVILTAAPDSDSVFAGWSGGCTGKLVACEVKLDSAKTATATFTKTVTLPKPPELVPPQTLAVSKDGTGTGTVSGTGINCGSDCSELIAAGTEVTLAATPATDSEFAGWSGDCTGTGNCVVTLDAAKSITATFTQTKELPTPPTIPPTQTLTVSKDGTGTGTVSGTGINCGADCSETLASGTQLTLTASAATGSIFVGWSGSGCSGTGVCEVTLDSAKSITATFTKSVELPKPPELVTPQTLTVTKFGTGTGTVSGIGVNCGSDCSESFAQGTSVILTAAPDSDSTFTSWSGACSGTSTSCEVKLDSAKTATATFTKTVGLPKPPELITPQTLTVSKAGTGTGSVAGVGINCGTDCSESLASGTEVTLAVTPATDSIFSGWSGDCATAGKATTCTLILDAAKIATATFTKSVQLPTPPTIPSTQTVTVTKSGTGTGTVSGIGINCGSDCSETLASGTQLTLTAAADTGSIFAGWSGDCTGILPACEVTLESVKTVTATFTKSVELPKPPELLLPQTLTVSKGGTGTGTVSGIGINCGSDCSETLVQGTSVILTAAPDSDSTFASWSGACSGTSTSCEVKLDSAKIATATFTKTVGLPKPPELITPRALTVSKAGTGTGTVSGIGINCGSDCAESFADGTPVVLTATPDTGSTFSSWSGGCTGILPTCTVTLDAAKSVIAVFTKLTELPKPPDLLLPQALAVSKSGTGTGTVTGSGINCGSVCTESLASGTEVTLTVTPSTDSTFSGWGGDCASFGKAPICTISMDASKAATAVFTKLTELPKPPELLNPQKLTVAKVGAGTVAGTGINCGNDCTESLAAGTQVTLTAAPAEGYLFSSWTGDCIGTLAVCTVTLDSAKTVTAVFKQSVELPKPPEIPQPTLLTITITKSGTGTGTVTSDLGGVNCGATCSVSYDPAKGPVVTLTATADAGSEFSKWGGGDCELFFNRITCPLNMLESKSVSAVFTKSAELPKPPPLPQPTTFTLSVDVAGTGSGKVTALSDFVCESGGATPCRAVLNAGQLVTLSAIPNADSDFSGWTGACALSGKIAICALKMDADKTISATFSPTGQICLGVLTPAYNPETKQCKTFTSSCLDAGWIKGECPYGADKENPTVTVSISPTSPKVGEQATFTAVANDDTGLRSVDIYVDGQKENAICSATPQSQLPTPPSLPGTTPSTPSVPQPPALPSGALVITGRQISPPSLPSIPSLPEATPPAEQQPQQNADLGKSLTCVLKKSFNAEGVHTYHAVATDTSGNIGSDPATGERNFNVVAAPVQGDTTKPVVDVFHSPLNPPTNTPITIVAKAKDNVAVSDVGLFVDGQKVNAKCGPGETIAPLPPPLPGVTPQQPKSDAITCTYTVSYDAEGTHSYYAKAADTSGNTQTSSQNNIEVFSPVVVDKVPPTVLVSHTLLGVPTEAGQRVLFTAKATDDNLLDSVGIFVDSVQVDAKCTPTVETPPAQQPPTPPELPETQPTTPTPPELPGTTPSTPQPPAPPELPTASLIAVSSPTGFATLPQPPAPPSLPGSTPQEEPQPEEQPQEEPTTPPSPPSLPGVSHELKSIGLTCVYEDVFEAGEHDYYATALDKAGNDARDPTGTATKGFTIQQLLPPPPPPQPGEIVLSEGDVSPTDKAVTLKWTPYVGAGLNLYLVQMKRTTETGFREVGQVASGLTETGVSTLFPDTDYNFKVDAVDSQGNTLASSNVLTLTTLPLALPPLPPLKAGLVIKLDSTTHKKATVSWNRFVDSQLTYFVLQSKEAAEPQPGKSKSQEKGRERKTDSRWVFESYANADDTSLVIDTLKPNREYELRLLAMKGAVPEVPPAQPPAPPSTPAQPTTPQPPSPPTPPSTPPSTPPAPTSRALTVTKIGTGTGTVTSSDGKINCGTTCTANEQAGALVILTAAPASGSTFTRWTGDCTGTGTCSVTMSAAKTVFATFTKSGTSIPPLPALPSLPTGGIIITGAQVAAQGEEPLPQNILATSNTVEAETKTIAAAALKVGKGEVKDNTAVLTFDKSELQDLIAEVPNLKFQIYEKETSAPDDAYELTGEASLNDPTFTIRGLSAGTGYTVRVDVYGIGSSYYIDSSGLIVFTTEPSPNNPPVASAGADKSCEVNSACNFDGSASSDSDGTISSYTWNFGDGATASGSTATHVYTTQGTYTVTLTVTDDKGVQAQDTLTATVNAAPVIPPPPPPPQQTYTLALTKAGTGSGSVTSDVGGINCGSTCSASVQSGTTVKLTATAASGSIFEGWSGSCVGSTLCPITLVSPNVLSATMSSDQTVTAKFSPTVTQPTCAQTLTPAYNPTTKECKTFTTTCIDSGWVAGQCPYPPTPPAPNKPPLASAGTDKSCEATKDCNFDGTLSSDPDGSIVSYDWNFGDSKSGSGSKTSHIYTSGGAFVVTLIVKDDKGSSASDELTVTVTGGAVPPLPPSNNPPVANAGPDITCLVNVPCNLDGSASTDPDAADSKSLTYLWDFGDGSSESGVSVAHTFTSAKAYLVTLTVKDPKGATSTDGAKLTIESGADINPLAPLAIVSAKPTSGSTPLTVEFDAAGSSSPASAIIAYTWDFGDGQSGTGIKAIHTYTTGGTYVATLTISDASGQTASNGVQIGVNSAITLPYVPPSLPPSLPALGGGEGAEEREAGFIESPYLPGFSEGGEAEAFGGFSPPPLPALPGSEGSITTVEDVGGRGPPYLPGLPTIEDSDGDGVTDNLDACPGTSSGTIVSTNGCRAGEEPSKSSCIVGDFRRIKLLVGTDVAPIANTCGLGGEWKIDIFRADPSAAESGGLSGAANLPSPRDSCSQIVPSWQGGTDVHRVYCGIDDGWYYVTYSAALGQ